MAAAWDFTVSLLVAAITVDNIGHTARLGGIVGGAGIALRIERVEALVQVLVPREVKIDVVLRQEIQKSIGLSIVNATGRNDGPMSRDNDPRHLISVGYSLLKISL